jgi:hypothetical protein
MPAPFKKVTVEQFAGILDRFQFTRSINAVHMHHTWRPNHAQFRGHDTIVSMWRYHTEHNGWSDIAQHITIDPEGAIWLGRNWNMAPASAGGHNGNAKAGPFMFEMIGDFDQGRDPFTGQQRATVLSVIALVQECFGLPAESLKFHNMMSGKTCPGSGIDYQQTVADVRQQRAQMGGARSAAASIAPPFPPDAYAANEVIEQALSDLSRRGGEQRADASADACTHHQADIDAHADADADANADANADAYTLASTDTVSMAFEPEYAATRAAPLTAAEIAQLRPHLINLTMGEFSTSGQWRTARADVDAIFSEHLPRALQAARSAGRPLRLMFQAHGGLNNEATGLAIAQKSVAWWQSNDIYPIYFAWETGLFETIGQLLRGAAGQRSLSMADYTSDPIVQEAVRVLQAPRIWAGMKQSAQLASSPGTGGAYYVAQQLAAFCRVNQDVELHAVGHSAGSIFHSWFIPCALSLGAPRFHSLHLMAPAMRVDLFKEKLASLIGAQRGIGELTVYTMKEDLETSDTCAGIYRKSLLYLIFHALEPQRKTPILGLEENLRADQELVNFFGLDGGTSPAGIVWSQSQSRQGRSASQAKSHGGFDEDPATMGSMARRILRKSDSESIREYQAGGRQTPIAQPAMGPVHAHQHDEIRVSAPGGARRALCVGINDYAYSPLTGCVADAETWTRSLQGAGFDVTALLNERATRSAIVGTLEKMIADSRSGDVLVFQYSGHGTQVPDDSGDELNGDTPGLDEALCPYDYAAGALLVDDDIGTIFARLPDGVNLTCFMDCCHSGTMSRFALAGMAAQRPADPTARPRYLRATPDMVEAHRRYRANTGGTRGAASKRGPSTMREVVFSACRSDEAAWESNGQGEFTVRATRILNASSGQLSNTEFADMVSAAFGEMPRQHAELDASSSSKTRMLLAPIAQAAQATQAAPLVMADAMPVEPLAASGPIALSPAGMPDLSELADLLRRVEHLLQSQLDMQGQLPNGKLKPKGKSAFQHPPAQSMQTGRQNR